jgi:hypothetical protein
MQRVVSKPFEGREGVTSFGDLSSGNSIRLTASSMSYICPVVYTTVWEGLGWRRWFSTG